MARCSRLLCLPLVYVAASPQSHCPPAHHPEPPPPPAVLQGEVVHSSRVLTAGPGTSMYSSVVQFADGDIGIAYDDGSDIVCPPKAAYGCGHNNETFKLITLRRVAAEDEEEGDDALEVHSPDSRKQMAPVKTDDEARPIAAHLTVMTYYTHPKLAELQIMHDWVTVVNEQATAAGAVATMSNWSLPSLVGELPWNPADNKTDLMSADALLMYDNVKNRSVEEYGYLQRNWRKALSRWAAPMLPLFANGTAQGIFTGDEVGCGTTKVNPANYSAVLTELRSIVGPRVVIYANECIHDISSSLHSKNDSKPGCCLPYPTPAKPTCPCNPHTRNPTPGYPTDGRFGGRPGNVDFPAVPEEFDLVSMDCYSKPSEENASMELAFTQAYYTENIFPSLREHQRVLLVPGTFACRDMGIAASDTEVALKLELYLAWAESDERIIGFNPWHLMTWESKNGRGPFGPDTGCGGEIGPGGSSTTMIGGPSQMPKTLAVLQRIGRGIRKNSQAIGGRMMPLKSDDDLGSERAAVQVLAISTTVVQTVDPKFVSFTMDTGALASGYANSDLEADDVLALARAVSPGYLRLSGGAADSLGYRATAAAAAASTEKEGGGAAPAPAPDELSSQHCTGGDCGNCDIANSPEGPPPVRLGTPTFWFNESSWRRINAFAAAAGMEIFFGLNSRARAATDKPWDGRFGMTRLVNWTAEQPLTRFPVAGYELGNEPDLFCRGNTTVLPQLMARDFEALRQQLDALGRASGREYRLHGPDTAGIGSHITNSTTGNPKAIYLHFFSQFAANLSQSPRVGHQGDQREGAIDAAVPPVLDELTFHQYYFKGPTADPSGRQFIAVDSLDSLREKISIATSHSAAPVSKHGASLGETSSAYDGGAPHLSDSFASTFSWVDKLGLSARFGLKRVMRQQLCCGSDYDLLQGRGHRPTADYWATLLWKRLMGGRVLAVSGDETPGQPLRAYAHCAANCSRPARSTGGGGDCGIALALVNVATTAATLDLRIEGSAGAAAPLSREVYRLGTVEGVFTGHRTTLNGQELVLTGAELPALRPVVETEGLMQLPALSVAFVVLPHAQARGCS